MYIATIEAVASVKFHDIYLAVDVHVHWQKHALACLMSILQGPAFVTCAIPFIHARMVISAGGPATTLSVYAHRECLSLNSSYAPGL